jgi:hypothetical protein
MMITKPPKPIRNENVNITALVIQIGIGLFVINVNVLHARYGKMINTAMVNEIWAG